MCRPVQTPHCTKISKFKLTDVEMNNIRNYLKKKKLCIAAIEYKFESST